MEQIALELVTVRTRQAFEFTHDGRSITVPIGYTVLPSKVFDSFRKTDFFNTLVEEGLLELDAEPQLSQQRKQERARKEHLEAQTFGPQDLVDAVRRNDAWRLLLPDGELLPSAYKTQEEALAAMLEANRHAWQVWSEVNPEAAQ